MSLWDKVLKQLKISLSEPSYKTWFKNTTLLPYNTDDENLVIEVPNAFCKDWLQGRYTTLISDTIFNITGKHYQLEFIVNPEKDITNKIKQPSTITNEMTDSAEYKLDAILLAMNKMDQRISELEAKIQNIKSK